MAAMAGMAFFTTTYETLWEKETACFDAACKNRFRSRGDVNQYVLREWQKLTGEFVPFNAAGFCGYYDVKEDNRRLIRTILGQKSSLVCINDTVGMADISAPEREIRKAFEKLLPEKSSFEL